MVLRYILAKRMPNEVTSADGAGPLRFAFGALRCATAEFCRWPQVPMRPLFLALTALALLTCASVRTNAADDLRQMWIARTNSLDQLAAALNAHFTNGTPMREIEAVLGRPSHTRTQTLTLPPEARYRMLWVYRFGAGQIMIRSTGGPATSPMDRGFAGAIVRAPENSVTVGRSATTTNKVWIGRADGSQPEWVKQAEQATNRIWIGQPGGTTNRSQPIR